MISSFGMSTIRSWEYTVGPIDPDPDDEHRFLEDTAKLSPSGSFAALDRRTR